MSFVRPIVAALSLLPAAGSAQVAVTPWVRVPDVSWVAPMVAASTSRAAAALDAARPALAALGPSLAHARVGMARAQAALAQTDLNLQGLRLSGAFWDDEEDFASRPPAPWAQQDPANTAYQDARAALNRQRYGEAARLFEQVYIKYPKSAYAGDAYYWQAYSLNRRGDEASLKKALDVLDQQKQKAPGANTRRDATALYTRIQGSLAEMGDADAAAQIARTATTAATPMPPAAVAAPGAPVPPTPAIAGTPGRRRGGDKCDDEDDTQVAALNALLSMDGDKALPILKKVLARRDEGSVCLRRKAVFMVSQHESSETEDILLGAARNDPDQEVREQAVWWLSQVDSPRAVAALDSILRSSPDPVLQDKAIFALSQQDSPKARQSLRDFALRAGVSEHLREQAIFWISQGDDPDRLDFLKQLYAQLKSFGARDKILFSVSQVEGKESQRWLIGVASDVNEDLELRKKALFWVGQSDVPVTELFNLYEKMPSREMKEQMIFVYSQRDEKAAVDKLLSIAKTETDRELKKKAIFWLSQSDDPRVADFLASLLEKPPTE